MIKKLILSTLRKLIVFLNVRLKIKKHPPSPPDYYFSEVSKNSYDYFKKYFDKAYVFSDDNSIRWDDVRALNKSDDNIPLDKKACRWNRSMEQTALEAENTKSSELLGSCGVAPTIKTA